MRHRQITLYVQSRYTLVWMGLDYKKHHVWLKLSGHSVGQCLPEARAPGPRTLPMGQGLIARAVPPPQLGSWAGWDWNCELHLPLSTGKCLKTLCFHYASERILKTSWSVLISTEECECLMIPQLFSICCTSLCGCATYRWPLPQVFFYCDVTMKEIVRKTWSSLKEIQRFLVSSKTSKVVFREKLIF